MTSFGQPLPRTVAMDRPAPDTKPPGLTWRRRLLYRSYARFHRLTEWRRQKFTPAGNMILWALLITGCFGIDTMRSTVYQALSFLSCLICVSLAWSFRSSPDSDVCRILPDYATAGSQFNYAVCITGASKKPASGLEIQEIFSDPRPTIHDFFSTPEPGEHTRNAWDRRFKVQRWAWLVRQAKNAREEIVRVPPLAPGETLEIRASLTPIHRGMIFFDGIAVLKPDPLNLTRSRRFKKQPDRVLVLPKRYALPPMAIPGSRKHHNGGLSLTSKVGDSDEFISLRDYRPGDAMRQIHWKSWAKTGNLIIRENQEEHFSRHALVLDTRCDDPHHQTFETAVSLAASFVAAINTGESLLDLMFTRNRVYRLSSGRQLCTPAKLLEVLALIQPENGDTFPELSRSVLAHSSKLSGITMILTALNPVRQELMSRLRQKGISMSVFLVCHDAPASETTAIHPILVSDVETSLNRIKGAS